MCAIMFKAIPLGSDGAAAQAERLRSAHRFFVRQYKSTTAVPAVPPRRFVKYDGKDASRCVIKAVAVNPAVLP